MGTSKNALFPRWLRQLHARRPKAARLGPTFLMYRSTRYGSLRGSYSGFALAPSGRPLDVVSASLRFLILAKKSLFFEVPK